MSLSLICPALPADVWHYILSLCSLTQYSTIARLSTHNRNYIYDKYPALLCMKAVYMKQHLVRMVYESIDKILFAHVMHVKEQIRNEILSHDNQFSDKNGSE